MVEIETRGRLHRISIFDPREIILKMTPPPVGNESGNSNKENSAAARVLEN